jgi:hypothetical protein
MSTPNEEKTLRQGAQPYRLRIAHGVLFLMGVVVVAVIAGGVAYSVYDAALPKFPGVHIDTFDAPEEYDFHFLCAFLMVLYQLLSGQADHSIHLCIVFLLACLGGLLIGWYSIFGWDPRAFEQWPEWPRAILGGGLLGGAILGLILVSIHVVAAKCVVQSPLFRRWQFNIRCFFIVSFAAAILLGYAVYRRGQYEDVRREVDYLRAQAIEPETETPADLLEQ